MKSGRFHAVGDFDTLMNKCPDLLMDYNEFMTHNDIVADVLSLCLI